MNINQLRIFVRIADLGNFTKAAIEMNYTQTAVSHMILSLEKECGFTLFHRGRRESRLTQEGAVLYKIAKDLIASYRRIEEYVQMVQTLQDGFVRIALLNSIVPGWFGAFTKSFKDAYPRVDLQIITVDTEDEIENLFDEKRLDFAVSKYLDRSGLENHFVFKDQLLLVVPNNHRFASRQKVGPEELLDEKILLCGEGATGVVGEIIYRVKRETRQHLDSMSNETTLSLVAAGVGIAVASERLQYNLQEGLVYIPFDPPIFRDMFLIESASTTENPAINSFRRECLQWFRGHVNPETYFLPMDINR